MDSAINKATSAFAKIGGDQVILTNIIVTTLKIWWSCQTYHRKLLYYHHHHNQQVRNFVLRKINLQWYLQPGACQDQQGDATLDEGKVIFLLCQGFGIFIELYILDLSFISRIINLTGWHTTTQITWNNGTMTICTCKRQTSFLSPWINDMNFFMQGSFHIIEPPVWLWTRLWPLRLQPQPTTTTTHQWRTVTHLPDWIWNWYRGERPAYCWRLLQRLPWSSDRLSRLSITAKKLDFLIRSSSREPETLKARSFGGLKRRFRGKSKNNSDS